MTKYLMKKFIGENSQETESHIIRSKYILMAGVVGIVVNIILATVKVIIGLISQSVAIVSDATNNFSDAASSLITLVGLKLSSRPADKRHPYGYGRIEYMSGVIVATLVIVVGVEFFKTSVDRILNPTEVHFTIVQLFILAVSIFAKLWLGNFNKKIGEKTNSSALKAAAADAVSDSIVSAITLLSAIVSKYTSLVIDGYVGFGMSIFIVYSGIQLLREPVSSIIGERADRELVQNIINEVKKYSPIMGAYDLILHNYGPTSYLGSVNVEVPDYLNVGEVYEVIKEAQRNVLDKYDTFLTIGLYSVNTYNIEVMDMKERINKLVVNFPHVIETHAFNLDWKNKTIQFDTVIDFEIKDYEKLRSDIVLAINKEYPEYRITINLDRDFSW